MPDRRIRPDNPAGAHAVTRARGGFTLIELLVVIGIIALLVGILLPALSQARGSAQVAVCASNQRQISMLWEMYLNDHDETFPVQPNGYQMTWRYGGDLEWWVPNPPERPLTPYTSEPEMFRCPSVRPIRNLAGGWVTQGASGTVYDVYEFIGNSYLGNHVILQTAVNNADKYWRGIRVPDIEVSTSQLILAGDPQWYYATNEPQYEADFHDRQNRINLTFVDGHVSFVTIEEDNYDTDSIRWVFFKTIPERWVGYFEEEADADG